MECARSVVKKRASTYSTSRTSLSPGRQPLSNITKKSKKTKKSATFVADFLKFSTP